MTGDELLYPEPISPIQKLVGNTGSALVTGGMIQDNNSKSHLVF